MYGESHPRPPIRLRFNVSVVLRVFVTSAEMVICHIDSDWVLFTNAYSARQKLAAAILAIARSVIEGFCN